jgi:hypothetical protein
MSKKLLVFELFEENISLAHLTEHWSMLTDRRTLSHAEILREKDAAVALAKQCWTGVSPVGGEDRTGRTGETPVQQSLARLVLLAETCRQFCRVVIAHVEEMWEGRARTTGDFESEAAVLLKMADDVEAKFGAKFFREMPGRMRGIVTGLRAEREREIPLRRQFAALPGVVDFVLCGFAAEGHAVGKRVHTGATVPWRDRYVRATGAGKAQGFSYELKVRPGKAHRLVVELAESGPGELTCGSVTAALPAGTREVTVELPALGTDRVRVFFASTTPQPCRVATIRVVEG